MFVFIVIIVCEGDIEIILYIVKVFEKNFFIIIMKGLGKVVDLVFDYLEMYISINYFEIVNI